MDGGPFSFWRRGSCGLRATWKFAQLASVNASDLFDFPASLPFAEYFDPIALPWEWVGQIKVALAGAKLDRRPDKVPPGALIEGAVYIHESVELPPFCSITGPVWIGEGVQIRPGAYLRGNVIVGAGSVLGNSCEYKNCLLMERVETPHFSYIGDSILGNRSHLGAGVILSNLRLDQKPIKVEWDGRRVDTGMRKLGALVGDRAEVGCNSVLNPGTILGRGSLVGPLTPFRGTLEAGRMALPKMETFTMPRPE